MLNMNGFSRDGIMEKWIKFVSGKEHASIIQKTDHVVICKKIVGDSFRRTCYYFNWMVLRFLQP